MSTLTKVFALGTLMVALAPHTTSQQRTSATLQLTLVDTDVTGSESRIQMNLHNTTDHPIRIELGETAGDFLIADRLHLFVSKDHRSMRPLRPTEPSGVAGAIEQFIVPLPAGSTLSMPIDLKLYWVFENGSEVHLQPGHYTLKAELKVPSVPSQMLDLLPRAYWTGIAVSNPLSITLTAK